MKPTNMLPQDGVNRQLSLFSPHFDASIRRVDHDGTTLFSVVDIIAQFTDSEAVEQYWRDTKKRLKTDGFQTQEKILRLKLTAKDGKQRLSDVTDGQTCLRIIQSLPSDKAEPIRQWLAELGYERLEESANPALIQSRARARYIKEQTRRGVDAETALVTWQERDDVIDVFKLMMKAVKGKVADPKYSDVVNAEYLALFESKAEELRKLLHTTSIRDALPPMQLAAIKMAEHMICEVVKAADRMTMTDLLDAIDEIVTPIGALLRRTAARAGVHHVTGQMLIRGGQ